MPTMDLLGTYAYQGAYVGPGAGVQVPDDPTLLSRIKEREERARQRRDMQMEATSELLPAGHPYKTLFPTNDAQPPQYEGEATPTFVPDRALKTPPDGFNVSDPASVSAVLQQLQAMGVTTEMLASLESANAAAQVGQPAKLPAWAPSAESDAGSTPPSTTPSRTPSDGEAGSPARPGSESSSSPADAGAAPPPAGSTSTPATPPANAPRKTSSGN